MNRFYEMVTRQSENTYAVGMCSQIIYMFPKSGKHLRGYLGS